MAKLLSTGAPSTLKSYRDLTAAFFGETSAATKFLDDKIAKQGEDEEVIADEQQMIQMLFEIDQRGNI
jgi:hypothetical protein